MIQLFLALSVFVFVAGEALAKPGGICSGAFAKAATVKSKPVKFSANKLSCRSLRDGPKGFQLQCIGRKDVRVASDRVAATWANCMMAAGFSEKPQGSNERMKILEYRNNAQGTFCTLINSAPEPGVDGWSVKMKCFGPR